MNGYKLLNRIYWLLACKIVELNFLMDIGLAKYAFPPEFRLPLFLKITKEDLSNMDLGLDDAQT